MLSSANWKAMNSRGKSLSQQFVSLRFSSGFLQISYYFHFFTLLKFCIELLYEVAVWLLGCFKWLLGGYILIQVKRALDFCNSLSPDTE